MDQSTTAVLIWGETDETGQGAGSQFSIPMPQSLWPLGLFLFVGTGARVTASTPKIRQALLAPSRNSHFAWDCNQRSFQRTGGVTRRADAARRGAVAHIRTERILL